MERRRFLLSGVTLAATVASWKSAHAQRAEGLAARYFLTDIRDFAGASAAWSDRYGKQPHPFAAVQVPGPLSSSGACLVSDFWMYAG